MDGRTDGWMEQRKALYGIRKISQRRRHWSMVLKGDVQCAGQRGMEKNRSKKDAPELRNGDAGPLGHGSEVPTVSFGEGPDPALHFCTPGPTTPSGCGLGSDRSRPLCLTLKSSREPGVIKQISAGCTNTPSPLRLKDNFSLIDFLPP